MLKMNIETSIDNLNYLRYMEHKDSGDKALKSSLESERATAEENNTQK